MSIFQVKSGIRDFINSEIWVDEWNVKQPENLPKIVDGVYYPSVAAVLAPVADLTTAYEENARVNSLATFRVDIAWRFNANAEFHELPLSITENLIEWVNYKAVSEYAEIWDKIYSVSVARNASPILVSRIDSDDQDWLIYAIFEWSISFPSIPIDPNDLGIIQPDKERSEGLIITSIGVRTHRQLPPDDILDKEFLVGSDDIEPTEELFKDNVWRFSSLWNIN